MKTQDIVKLMSATLSGAKVNEQNAKKRNSKTQVKNAQWKLNLKLVTILTKDDRIFWNLSRTWSRTQPQNFSIFSFKIF